MHNLSRLIKENEQFWNQSGLLLKDVEQFVENFVRKLQLFRRMYHDISLSLIITEVLLLDDIGHRQKDSSKDIRPARVT